MIIAVDFDGTLFEEAEFPNYGKPNLLLIQDCIDRRKRGDKIILWTSRCNDGFVPGALDMAVEACKKYGLEFDAVNDNVQETIDKYKVNGMKVYADIYIDDHSLNPTLMKM